MLSRTRRRRIGLLAVSLIAAATVSVGTYVAAAANVRHTRHAYPSHAYTNHAYASHRHGPWYARGATLPYGPEYGFLRKLPPNAIVGPVIHSCRAWASLARPATCRRALAQTSTATSSRLGCLALLLDRLRRSLQTSDASLAPPHCRTRRATA